MPEKKSKPVEIKTKQNSASVEDFINSIKDEQKRKDSFTILNLMKKLSGDEPKMWGASLIGFGKRIYKSPKTGREVEWFEMGFSPRKANLSVQLGLDIQQHSEALKRLGKHSTGVGCLYINELADINLDVLIEMIETTIKNK